MLSIPLLDLLPADLAGMLGREAYAAQVPAVSSGNKDKAADSGASSGASVSVSRFTGSAKAHIPIAVAPGRSEATTPTLSLAYSSARGNGWLGMGWMLDTGCIKRGYKTDDHYLVMDGVSPETYFPEGRERHPRMAHGILRRCNIEDLFGQEAGLRVPSEREREGFWFALLVCLIYVS